MKRQQSTVHLHTAEIGEQFQLLLQEFDRLVRDLGGNPESEPAQHFRSLLAAQSEGLIEHLRILSAIFYMSSLLSSHSSLSEVLSLIVGSVKELLNFGRVLILLLNQDRTILRCEISSGLTYQQTKKALSRPFLMDRHDCIETKAVRSGKSYLITSTDDPRLTDIDLKTIETFERGCTIYAPINSKNGILGLLGVDRQSSLPLLQPRDVERVQIFANYIGVLIENAKLYESIIDHKNRFENIVRQTPNGIITTNPSGKVDLINRSARKLLGIDDGDFLTRPVEDLLGVDIMTKVREVLSKSDQTQFYDLEFNRPNSRPLILNLFASNAKTDSGSGLLIALQDITEKKTIDKHLRRLDKLASIGTMAAGIAHEIRSPLTSISMDLDMLYESASDKKKVQDTIVGVLTEIERIDDIVNNLLQFARPTVEDVSLLGIRKVIEDSIALVKKQLGKKPIRFHCHFRPENLEILGNPGRLKQMMVNLLLNAVEAIENEGVVTIKADLVSQKSGPLGGMLKGSSLEKVRQVLRISIEDDGIGVASEFRDKIFDPYFTTKSYGTGLGLAIVSKIVEEHEGYMSFISELGKGALFEVFLPMATSEAGRVADHEQHLDR